VVEDVAAATVVAGADVSVRLAADVGGAGVPAGSDVAAVAAVSVAAVSVVGTVSVSSLRAISISATIATATPTNPAARASQRRRLVPSSCAPLPTGWCPPSAASSRSVIAASLPSTQPNQPAAWMIPRSWPKATGSFDPFGHRLRARN
jgi:hypothetical protein